MGCYFDLHSQKLHIFAFFFFIVFNFGNKNIHKISTPLSEISFYIHLSIYTHLNFLKLYSLTLLPKVSNVCATISVSFSVNPFFTTIKLCATGTADCVIISDCSRNLRKRIQYYF